ncbi:unnamed protein product [Prorocentrum cordatum]|uniref:Uncharacterized protein n=1 Tax=Prorocentrum cordatum TaxID=2364126 RepID=A0ABN9U030_9DINO|nr:unnamed protein product [Polarella glacialis]
MAALGAHLCSDGNTRASVDYRTEAGERYFWTQPKVPQGRGAVRSKLRAWSAGPASSMRFGACSWHLRGRAPAGVRRREDIFLGEVFHSRWKRDEWRAKYGRRASQVIQRFMGAEMIKQFSLRV